ILLLIALPTLIHFLFYFSVYGDHRDLHSFPTRRSSDLRFCHARRRTGATKVHSSIIRPRRCSTRTAARFIRASVITSAATRRFIDRKSTRLNSSHLGISYAVFCLKKKKKI